MDLESYVSQAIGIRTALYVPAEDMIIRAQDNLRLRFGFELKSYLKGFGYIRRDPVRFYGLSLCEKDNSIIEATRWLHDRFVSTRYFVCIQAKDRKNVVLVDSRDNIYTYRIGSNVVVGRYMKLNDYIMKELSGVT